MDALFALPPAPRADFLRSLLQSFRCTYVSLWQYDSNLSNRLFFFDGFYHLPHNQPTSSLRTQSQTLFHQYRALTFDVNDNCVPGLAFRNHIPYIELQLLDLLSLTSTEIQKQFFQEARIEIAVFMGCRMGEIELGFSNKSQADIHTELKNLFPEDFYTHSQSIDQNPQSSSSSSFISISTGSPNQCSLNISGTSHSNFPEALGVAPPQPSPPQQTIHALSQPNYLNLSTPDAEHEEIVRTLIQVISSTSQLHQPHPILPHTSVIHPETTAFTRYRPDMINPGIKPHTESNFRRQSLHNTSFALFQNSNSKRMRERDTIQVPHPISTQQHFHMISERRRREKLSDSFQALRALLPPGTKKNKETILSTAMAEIEKLNMRKQQPMTDLSGKEGSSCEENRGRSSNERLDVRVRHTSESSSSKEHMVDLQVTVRRQSSQIDLLLPVLRFLERVQNVTLISTNANNHVTEGGATINEITFRLRIIEGSEWDKREFEEAIRRVVFDVIQRQFQL